MVNRLKLLERIGVKLIWFDSLGAKSASIYIDGSVGGIVIDPGAAAMQPSYPLPSEEKRKLRSKAIEEIEKFCWKAKFIVITHYHYDHHVLPFSGDLRDPKSMYLGKKMIIVKNPNMYINESQWNRARTFIEQLLSLDNKDIKEYLIEPELTEFQDLVELLEHAMSKDFGSYSNRRRELLEKGRKWFRNLVEKLWSAKPWIKDKITFSDGTLLVWGDGKCFELGDTLFYIFPPWFHGIEYDRTGWVFPVLIVKNNYRLFYTRDLMGPQIEDYAYVIARLKPDIIIADGPPTYLYPYMLNKINLNRAVENMVYIIENAQPKLIIYDHHLLRERKWRKRVNKVFKVASKANIPLITAAEYLGKKPLIDVI